MIVVRELRKAASHSPSRWQERVGDHGSIHIRYRWGMLTARVSETGPDLAEHSRIVFDQPVGGRLSGLSQYRRNAGRARLRLPFLSGEPEA